MSLLAPAQAKTQSSKSDSSTSVSGLVQRKCACGSAAGVTGSCPACESERRFGTPPIQAKLKISEPRDRYEQEADRVADEVMRMPEPMYIGDAKVFGRPPSANIQRKCAKCEDEVQRQPEEDEDEEGALQPKKLPGQGSLVTPHTRARISMLRGRGNPLSKSERAFFEARFGADFGGVRIHDNQPAAETTQALNARAFTFGQDIVFGNRQYQPGTDAGRRLLAHELTHTLQQERPGAGGLSEQVMTKPEITSIPGDGSALEEPVEGNEPLATVACNDTQSKIVDTAVHDTRKLAADAANDARTLLALGTKAPQHLVVNFGCWFGSLILKNLTAVSRGFGEILTHLNQAALSFECDTTRPFRTFRCKTDARNRKTPAHTRKKSDSPITLCRSFFEPEVEAVFNDAKSKRAFILIQQVGNKVLPLPVLRRSRPGSFRRSRLRASLAPLLARNNAESFGMFALFHDRELDPDDCTLSSKQRWSESQERERQRLRRQRGPGNIEENMEPCEKNSKDTSVEKQHDDYGCCDDERSTREEKAKLIRSGIELAREAMPIAAKRLKNNEVFECWFGTKDEDTFNDVKEKFEIVTERISKDPILWKCDPGLKGSCSEGYVAHTRSNIMSPIFLCAKFFESNVEDRAFIIVHEVFHNAGVTFGKWPNGKNPEIYVHKDIVTLPIHDRKNNAETYAGLAKSIFKVLSCPTAKLPDVQIDPSCERNPNDSEARHTPEKKIQIALKGAQQAIKKADDLLDQNASKPLDEIEDEILREALRRHFDSANTGGLSVDVIDEIHKNIQGMKIWIYRGPLRFECDFKNETRGCKEREKEYAAWADPPTVTICRMAFVDGLNVNCDAFTRAAILHEVAHFPNEVIDVVVQLPKKNYYKPGEGSGLAYTPGEPSGLEPQKAKLNADSYANFIYEIQKVHGIECSFLQDS